MQAKRRKTQLAGFVLKAAVSENLSQPARKTKRKVGGSAIHTAGTATAALALSAGSSVRTISAMMGLSASSLHLMDAVSVASTSATIARSGAGYGTLNVGRTFTM